MTFLKFIVRDPRAEVMDVMETDISSEPLQNFWKLIEGTAIHASVEEFPLRVAFPVRRVEIVLHIE